ncbi:50S ribosomal protein L21 [Candidatus Curculioniphilus buchneri]|uniref:50S ribosomal protein L21 n=1 Tax=Candidatus Curculioniphilus buchneri TaxID=690594 RepID=UPI00376F0718
MYAIFKSGGKQYRVKQGQTIRLEKLDIDTGNSIEFKKIMMIARGETIKIGDPFIKNSKITAKIISHGRSNKITILKFHRRKHFRKHRGHRQWFTDVQIVGIQI